MKFLLLGLASALVCKQKSLYSGQGNGTYYYDVLGNHCPYDSNYIEVNGYTSCESYTPGPNQKKLQERNTNYIVAIDNDKLQEKGGRERYCGKRIIVKYKGKTIDKKFIVWDGCAACKNGARLDFSLSALQGITSNACFLGVVPGIEWSVTNEQLIKFIP